MIRRLLREALGLPSRVELDAYRRRVDRDRAKWAGDRISLVARAVAAETELDLVADEVRKLRQERAEIEIELAAALAGWQGALEGECPTNNQPTTEEAEDYGNH